LNQNNMAPTGSKENIEQKKISQHERSFFQAKLTINNPGDRYEQEADAVADKIVGLSHSSSDALISDNSGMNVSRILDADIQKKCAECEEEEQIQMKGYYQGGKLEPEIENNIQSAKGGGENMNTATQSWMESQFGHRFGGVKVHNDGNSDQLNRKLNSRAFTTGSSIFFKSGEYNPGSKEGKKLLAHELTHVVQQSKGEKTIQRTVELRPPGRGEASAFERRQEIVDRLNALSNAVTYSLNGQVLEYKLIEGNEQSFFDRSMISFIDSGSVLPLRLITGAGLVGSTSSGFSPLLIDSFMSGYFDLEDMMNSDDTSFQMNLLHILIERSRARDYARRIGSAGLSPIDASGNLTPEFRRAHQAGIDAETMFLQDIFTDPTIRFVRERSRGQSVTFTFRSSDGYRINHTFRRQNQTVSGGSVIVINAAGDRVSVDDFIQQRAAVAP